MKRSFGDTVKAFMKSMFAGCGDAPVAERIDCAKMSHTRLKALDKPTDHSTASQTGIKLAANVQPAGTVQPATKVQPNHEKNDRSQLLSKIEAVEKAIMETTQTGEIAKLPPTLPGATKISNVSHYRLAAYVANLPAEQREKAFEEEIAEKV